jgi:hypothetical protein
LNLSIFALLLGLLVGAALGYIRGRVAESKTYPEYVKAAIANRDAYWETRLVRIQIAIERPKDFNTTKWWTLVSGSIGGGVIHTDEVDPRQLIGGNAIPIWGVRTSWEKDGK